MHSDPISDMITRMRNAQMADHSSVTFPYSKVKELIVSLLKEENFIDSFQVEGEGKDKNINLSFNSRRPNLTLTRISKPGQKIYKQYADLRRVKRGRGILVVSTSAGVLPGYKAYAQKIGGEVMVEVY